MSEFDRRSFLTRAAVLTAGGLALAGPFQTMVARSALAGRSRPLSPAPDNGGYGPLVPVPDARDGVVRLWVPEGFRYRSFSHSGIDTLVDGTPVPAKSDGMAAFDIGPGYSRTRLVRNHEINGNTGSGAKLFGDPATAYDPAAPGGTTTIEVNRHATRVRAWVSANGTQMNCSGGQMPWGSWVTCEETVNGPDVGPDFTGAPNTALTQPHGYIFEVPASRNPGDRWRSVPIRSAGRFAHEAVALDPHTGVLYMTEDNFGFPSGFYRYDPPAGTHPVYDRKLSDGGTLWMLKVKGQHNAPLADGYPDGTTWDVEWVRIEDPDHAHRTDHTNNGAVKYVGDQGRAQGAALFSRLEGAGWDAEDETVWFVSTQGGATPPGEKGPSGYGDGFGQVFMYQPRTEKLTMVFESRSREVLDMPDNVALSPRGAVMLAEDGNDTAHYLRALHSDGTMINLAKNAVPGQEKDEIAGITFDPHGHTAFFNVQSTAAITFAMWGPWGRGVV